MIDFQAFHFLRPEWFLGLLPLVVLLLAIRYLHKQQSGWQAVLAGHLYQHLVTSKGNRKSRPPLTLLALGWLLTVVALAGPTWEQLPQPVFQLNTGKVVVMDMSMSMRATDVPPNRLSRARFKAMDLVNAISEGETGLVAYAGDAFTISPLSSDAQNLTALIPSLSPEIMPIAGSEPYLGLSSAAELLKNAGFQQGEIFWITDGIDTVQLQEVRELVQSMPYRLSVLAIGTEDGAPIQMLDGELLKDGRGAIVIPKLTENNLRILASDGGGRYVPMQADDSDIQFLTNQGLVDRESTGSEEEQSQSGDEWKEMGPYLLLLLLPLAAYSFRRGLMAVFLVGILLPGYTPTAQANWWQDLWKTGDQQGQHAFNTDNFDVAAEKFDDPMWKGSALYRQGNYEGALEEFAKLDTTDSLYNQGNSLAHMGEIDEAIAAYEQVLARDPEHADAKANKELLEQQQKQQQDQQQQQEQDQQNQQQQDQQQDDQQSQDSDQQQQDQQDQQSQENSSSEDQNSSQEQQEQPEQDPESQQQEQEQQEQQEQEARDAEQQEAEAQQAEPQELTDEQKEQMQRMQNLLRKIPDDPAYLLKRKMQLEHQQRRRERVPAQLQRNW